MAQTGRQECPAADGRLMRAAQPVDGSALGSATTLAMAVACGVAVANIYYNQPMLGIMEATYPGQSSITGLVPMATQLGYALGLLLLVPLGDRTERRRLILLQFGALAVTSAGAAIAPGAWALVAASLAVGVTSSVAQQVVPFAAELAPPSRRGATIGTVMSGLLCGILFGRAVAGLVGNAFGWRAMFWLGLATALATGGLMAAVLPRSQPKVTTPYRQLLTSLVTLWRDEPALRTATYIQAALFASFSALWTTLALRLAAKYHLGPDIAGLFGFVGAVGVLVAPFAGKLADRKGPHATIAFGAAVMVVSWLCFGLWSTIPGLIVGVIVLDLGEQSAMVSNQHVIYALRADARNRLNTIFMSGMFVGGAAGSAGSILAWSWGGWNAVCGIGLGVTLLALAVHVIARRGLA